MTCVVCPNLRIDFCCRLEDGFGCYHHRRRACRTGNCSRTPSQTLRQDQHLRTNAGSASARRHHHLSPLRHPIPQRNQRVRNSVFFLYFIEFELSNLVNALSRSAIEFSDVCETDKIGNRLIPSRKSQKSVNRNRGYLTQRWSFLQRTLHENLPKSKPYPSLSHTLPQELPIWVTLLYLMKNMMMKLKFIYWMKTVKNSALKVDF